MIAGETAPQGIYDPSVEYEEDGIGWMSYSAVTAGNNACVETNLAKTTNHGETWVFVSSINPCNDDSVVEDGETMAGRWRYEVATILHDPKLSPDGSKAAFLRRVKQGPFFHVVVVDVNMKEGKDLSAGYSPESARVFFDGPPEWSSDGELLIFPRILADANTVVAGIHTIRPDGIGRETVPLPRNYVYGHTSSFPDEGSNDNTRIIFSATKTKD